ncbi:unnamed protein product [Chrysoparadoxa australica]
MQVELPTTYQDLSLWLGAIGLCCVAAYRLVQTLVFYHKCGKLAKTVPGVAGGLPILGQCINMLRTSPWDLMTEWAKQYGPIYRFNLFGTQCIVIADPHYMKEVMRTKMMKYHKDLVFAYKPFYSLLGTGIVTSEGQKWRQQRNRVSSIFRIELLEEIPEIALRATERLAVRLDEVSAKDESIEIGEEFRHLTLQVISEVLLSLSPEESDEIFAHAYLPIVIEGHHRVWNPLREFCCFLPFWWQHRSNVAELNSYMEGLIDSRWELRKKEASAGGTGRKQDVLDRIMNHFGPEDWTRATVRQIRDEMKTFVLAGHETSASMLNWALYELSQRDDCCRKVVAEAEAVWGAKGLGLGAAGLAPKKELDKLQYTDAVLRESLRKYNLVPVVSRVAVEDTTIDGPQGQSHLIPKGSIVMLLIQGVHMREDIWPEPHEFSPERYDMPSPPAPYTFLPFIEGPRMCLGQYMSLLESKVVLSLLYHKYSFELQNAHNGGERHPWIIPVVPHHGTHIKVQLRKRAGGSVN